MQIGVYICHCGINIADHVDVEALTCFSQNHPHIAIARDYTYICSDPGQDLIVKDIERYQLDRIVVAACSPTMHEDTFRKTISKSGLNPYFLEIANIREQCSWVHDDRTRATEKAKDLVLAAIAKSMLLEPLEEEDVQVIPSSLVIGGGIAGLQSALDIADSGFKVFLIEKDPSIGGHMAQLNKTYPTMEMVDNLILQKMKGADEHPNIELLTYAEIVAVEGFFGNFTVTLRKKPRYVDPSKCTNCGHCEEICPVRIPNEFNLGLDHRPAIYLPFCQAIPHSYVIDPVACQYVAGGECGRCVEVCPSRAINFDQKEKERVIEVGTIVIATGFEPFDASLKPEFGYYRYERVITGLELERFLSPLGPTGGNLPPHWAEPENIIFIQCVGSRDKAVGNEYCSRICCMYTAKQADLLREKLPGARITICYIDIRAFGKGHEEFYERVQKAGVIYRKGIPSEIFQKGEKLIVKAEDSLLGELYEEEADLVVLATGLNPSREADKVRNLLKVNWGPDRFFMEAHPKLRPLDATVDGIYLSGACQGPKDITDTIAHAHGSASRATIPLFKGKVKIDPIIASIDGEICSGCGLCEDMCEYQALKMDDYRGRITVNAALCKGCGACHSVCPVKAITVKQFNTEQVFVQIEVMA
ncbi:MAG: CoB--CoM heterodisulfide reductase iron-sulfur subunit A family protein [Syntrophobacterales bacterium]|nr:MAG: CoB--CoM heterodisulfide reductase iron-sulfur subunit A family protein [Syntrophobacterales bacterium]